MNQNTQKALVGQQSSKQNSLLQSKQQQQKQADFKSPQPTQQLKKQALEQSNETLQKQAVKKDPFVPKYKLGYWAVRGKAERIRILLQYLQVPYQEVRYTLLSKGQWYDETKPLLLKKNPNMSLPFLIDGDQVICESQAIMAYICYRQNRIDLLGRNGTEKVKMATAMGIFHKLQYDFEQLCYGFYDQQNKSFQYARDEAEQYKFKPKIKMLTQIIQNNDFFCGMDNITYVDFIIADFLEILFFLCSRLKDDNIILNYYQRQFWKMPPLAAYVKSGRFFRRPYNEPHAVWR